MSYLHDIDFHWFQQFKSTAELWLAFWKKSKQ